MRNLAVVVAVWVLIAGGAHAQVSAQISTSRTSGVAPLAVFFDGTGSSGGDSIHELDYRWDFGDPSSGTWSHSGISKNIGDGPWTGHVFDRPGTYTVKVTVTAPNGQSGTRTRTINVTDPDSVFSGNNTICVSSGGSFSGCPSGARQVTTSNFGTGAGNAGTGKRVLFRRGDSFSGGGAFINEAGPGIIGAFGTGAAPRINVTNSAVVTLSGRTPNTDDWRIMDLDMRGNGSQYSAMVAAEGAADKVLLYRLSGTRYHDGIAFAPSVVNYHGQPNLSRDLSIVDCDLQNMEGGLGGGGMYLGASRVLIMGNSIDNVEDTEHNIRTPYLGDAVIAHNFLHRPRSQKVLLKIHGQDLARARSVAERDSHNIRIAHNHFKARLNAWSIELGPQNSLVDERVSDVIVEHNFFEAGQSSQSHLNIFGRDVTVRGNVFQLNGGVSATAVSISQRGIEPAPRNVRMYNNSCNASDNRQSAYCLLDHAGTPNIFAANNLMYAPNVNQKAVIQANGTLRDNLMASSNPYKNASGSSATDFELRSGSAAIDAGGSVPWLGTDFAGDDRPAGNDWDVGAFESGSSGGGGGGSTGGGNSGGGGGGPTPSPPPAPVLLP